MGTIHAPLGDCANDYVEPGESPNGEGGVSIASIRDGAKAVGVSTATVSPVINGRAGASAAVRARVIAAAEELRYVPDSAARTLITGAPTEWGCCCPTSTAGSSPSSSAAPISRHAATSCRSSSRRLTAQPRRPRRPSGPCAGYQRALTQLCPSAQPIVLPSLFTEEAGFTAGHRLARLGPRPDVDIPLAKFVQPALTTVRVPVRSLGEEALDHLAAHLRYSARERWSASCPCRS